MSFLHNLLLKILPFTLRFGLGPSNACLLTVPGQGDGVRSSAYVVFLVREGARHWLVAPAGASPWLEAAQAAGRVVLRQGRAVDEHTLREVPPVQRPPVLRRYLNEVPYHRRYFNVTPTSPFNDYIEEAPKHPVFLLQPPES